jgi:light-harvesting complex I chlorophyll a/b binding protein 1
MYSASIIALVAAFGSASAFVPGAFTGSQLQSVKSTSSLNMKQDSGPAINSLEEMSGATAPLPYWDPLGFSTKVDDQELQKYREAEIKHGRVAMLAALGMIVQEQFHPFFGTADQQLGPAAFHLQEVGVNYPQLPLILLGGIAAVEAATINKGWSKQNYKEEGLGEGFVANLKTDYFPGDLGFDPLGLYPSDPQGLTDIRNKELNNGRLAMISIWGMWAQELVDKLTLGEHFARHGLGPSVAEMPLEQASNAVASLSQ